MLYVHTGSDATDDSFAVQVANSNGEQAEPVTLTVTVVERTLGSIDLSSLSAADGFIIQGDAADDQAGYSVSGAGDVNGDGFADLLVGARYGDDGGSNAGEAYLVFGKAAGFGSRVETTDTEGMGTGVFRQVIDLSSLSAADGFIIQGDAVGDRAGESISGAGDVNGDGFADLLVGANFGSDGGPFAGEAYLVFGKASGFGRLDSDTNRRVIDLERLAPEDGFIIQGDTADDSAGISVSGAGDVNGDGFADLLVGADAGDDGGSNAGEAYLVFGKESGFGSLDSDTNRRVIDLSGLSAADGFIIQGDANYDFAGGSVSGASDVNGDGFADLLVRARYGDDGGRDAGEAYLVFGKASGFGSLDSDTNRRVIDLERLAPEDGFIIQGDAADDRAGYSVSGAGDLLKFDGGTGTDTLRLSGGGLTLDLTTLPNTRLTSIERIDLAAGGNSLVLSRLDLLALSELRANGRAELRVDGGTGDSVSISEAGWTQQDDEDLDGTTYAVFDNGQARLLVNSAVNANGIMLTSSLRMAEMHGEAEPASDTAPPSTELDPRLRFDADTLRLDAGGLALDLASLTDTPDLARIDLAAGGNSLVLSRLDLLALSELRADGQAELWIDGDATDSIRIEEAGWTR